MKLDATFFSDTWQSPQAMLMLKFICCGIWVVSALTILRNPEFFMGNNLKNQIPVMYTCLMSVVLYISSDIFLPERESDKKSEDPGESVCEGAKP